MIATPKGYDSKEKDLVVLAARGKRNTIHMDVYIDLDIKRKDGGRK